MSPDFATQASQIARLDGRTARDTGETESVPVERARALVAEGRRVERRLHGQ